MVTVTHKCHKRERCTHKHSFSPLIMARRRAHSNANAGPPAQLNTATASPRSRPAHQQHQPQPSTEGQTTNLGMSEEARYAHNLKVLRRRDSSITSIFDQFTHVCVYHHNGQTWEKNGYEGSMFLYERDSYPPYGFYILNRMGMEDYVQRLYPEDISGLHGTYLMLRSYPEFTNRRLSQIYRTHEQPLDKFSDVFRVYDLDTLSDADKGRGSTIGLWMFPTDAREPMMDVMIRLHSYVKQNMPYPDVFRYGPGRPPPPNPHLRTTNSSPSVSERSCAKAQTPTVTSDLSKLLAKLTTNSSSGSLSGALPSPAQSSSVTLDSLFASVGGGNAPPSPVAPRSGIPLLDSIFASAAPSVVPLSPPKSLTIHSPTPTVHSLPQILNHDVITALLGLPPSRSASTSSFSGRSDSRSHTTSREGDNEYEDSPGNNQEPGGEGTDSFSESTTVLDLDAQLKEQLQAVNSNTGQPELVLPANGPSTMNGIHSNGKGRVHGDVTPKAPVPLVLANGDRPVPPALVDATSGSSSTVRPDALSRSGHFASGSDIWLENGAHPDHPEDEDIVELDFADTSVLSDPDAFHRASRRQHQVAIPDVGTGRRGKSRRKGKRVVRSQENHVLSACSSRSASASPLPGDSPIRPAPLQAMSQSEPATARAIVNGQNPQPMLDPAKARASIITAISAQAQAPQPQLDRNDFIREVLTLIHTNKSFVDTLFHEYNSTRPN